MTKIDHICYHTVTHFPYTSVLTLVPAEVVEEGLYKEVIPVLTERGEAEITHRDERTKSTVSSGKNEKLERSTELQKITLVRYSDWIN